MSLITFYIQNTLNKLTRYPPAAWESPSHLSQWIFTARQFRSVAVCPINSGLFW